MDEVRLLAEWEQELSDDPAYVAHGLLCEITEDICRAMDRLGMTRTELAQRLGVSRQYVTNFLNAPGNTTLKQVVRFAVAVGLDVQVTLAMREDPRAPRTARDEARAPDGDVAAVEGTTGGKT